MNNTLKEAISESEALTPKTTVARRAISRAVDMLRKAMSDAEEELDYAEYDYPVEDLGELYLSFDHEKAGIYLSTSQIDGGWTLSFDYIARELAESVSDCEEEDGPVELVARLRELADSVEKLITEDQ